MWWKDEIGLDPDLDPILLYSHIIVYNINDKQLNTGTLGVK